MTKKLQYINTQNQVIDFRQFNTQIYQAGFHSYTWEYEGTQQQYGTVISQFTKSPLEYEMIIAIRGTQKEKEQVLNNITDIVEYDIVNNVQGQLWWGDYYLNCNIITANTEPSDVFTGAEKTMGILAPYPFWIKPLKKSFYPDAGGNEGNGFLNYDYNYNYNYTAAASGSTQWAVDHYAPSEFQMIIYGPCVDPSININGWTYGFTDTLQANEYAIIDSQNNTIIKYRANGTTANLWNNRFTEQSVFEPIPSGILNVNWSGAFGFDITLYIERSEPKW